MATLTAVEQTYISKFFNNAGYVLNFSDSDFRLFTMEHLGYSLKDKYNLSKGKSLENFFKEAEISEATRFLQALVKYCEDNPNVFEYLVTMYGEKDKNNYNYIKCKEIIEKYSNTSPIITDLISPEQELTTLLEIAVEKIHSGNIVDKQIAVEKIWDAFERMKTLYEDSATNIDKRKSAEMIVDKISNNKQNWIDLFNTEFKTLTDIGNTYRIRHHETTKINIEKSEWLNYFFGRCYALISMVIQFIK